MNLHSLAFGRELLPWSRPMSALGFRRALMAAALPPELLPAPPGSALSSRSFLSQFVTIIVEPVWGAAVLLKAAAPACGPRSPPRQSWM